MTEFDRPIKLFYATGRKTVALSFIILILLANYWIVERLIRRPLEGWVFDVFLGASASTFLGVLMMLPNLLVPSITVDESNLDSLNDN